MVRKDLLSQGGYRKIAYVELVKKETGCCLCWRMFLRRWRCWWWWWWWLLIAVCCKLLFEISGEWWWLLVAVCCRCRFEFSGEWWWLTGCEASSRTGGENWYFLVFGKYLYVSKGSQIQSWIWARFSTQVCEPSVDILKIRKTNAVGRQMPQER